MMHVFTSTFGFLFNNISIMRVQHSNRNFHNLLPEVQIAIARARVLSCDHNYTIPDPGAYIMMKLHLKRSLLLAVVRSLIYKLGFVFEYSDLYLFIQYALMCQSIRNLIPPPPPPPGNPNTILD